MNAHEQYAEDLALYAMGVLDEATCATVKQHLAGCAACREELEKLRADSSLLALSTIGPKPPQRARQRLMESIQRESRTSIIVPKRARASWWAPLGWAAAAAMVIFALALWRENGSLRNQLGSLQALATEQAVQLQRANEVVATLESSDSMRVTLVSAKTPPQPQGKAIYDRRRASLIFLASNIPVPPPQKAYELWLIPTTGAPVPAGVFRPDAHGSATLINPPIPSGLEAKAFAITLEPESGSSTPTSPILMVGSGL